MIITANFTKNILKKAKNNTIQKQEKDIIKKAKKEERQDIKEKLEQNSYRVHQKMETVLARYKRRHYNVIDKTLTSATDYVLLSQSKKIRAFMVMESAKMLGFNISAAMDIAIAIEMIHSYSLVHDDLPDLDDDDYRRGQKSCHKKFGIVNAILTGDLLQPLAYEFILSSKNLTDRQKVVCTRELAIASGIRGMVSGQGLDMKIANKKVNNVDRNYLTHVHRLKTGKLFEFSASIIAKAMGLSSETIRQFEHFGINYGFIFQIVDDIDDYKQGKDEEQSFVKYSDSVEDLVNHVNILGSSIKSLLNDKFGENGLSELLDETLNKIESV